MKRFAVALAAATLIGTSPFWLGAPAHAGPSGVGQIPPTRAVKQDAPAAPKGAPEPRLYAVKDDPLRENLWTDPTGTFSFANTENWKDIEAASPPGAAVLEIVGSDRKSECWFERIAREKTAHLSPADLIAERSKPLDHATWSRLAADQHLLQGYADVIDTRVERQGIWPVQTAWLRGRQGDVYAALHARPGLDVWVFCASRDTKSRGGSLSRIARSVTTPKDFLWERQMQSQASFTAVP